MFLRTLLFSYISTVDNTYLQIRRKRRLKFRLNSFRLFQENSAKPVIKQKNNWFFNVK